MAIQHKNSYAMSSSAAVGGSAFEVEADAKLFATLTASLYTDKQVAVPREMLCNMKDAHIERNELYQAGTLIAPVTSVYAAKARMEFLEQHKEQLKWYAPKDKMYELQVPSVLDPTMVFKDFGIGLSVDQIMGPVQTTFDNETNKPIILRDEKGHPVRRGGLYKTIFKSTKENSNLTTGAYGLGSKSPYALCDTFTVESRFNGEKHMYIMYMTEDRQPMVDWITKCPETGEPAPISTDEYNGLTVSMVIQEHDIQRVIAGCERVLRSFEPEWQPELFGQPINVEMYDRTSRIGNMFVQPEVEENGVKTHYAVQGSVAYPVNTQYLDKDIRMILNSMGADTYTEFPIGLLNVPPSREQLDYVKWTVDNLNQHYRHSLDSFKDRVIKDIMDTYKKFESVDGSPAWSLHRYTAVKELRERWGTTLFESAMEQIQDKRYKRFGETDGDSVFPRPKVKYTKMIDVVQPDGSFIQQEKVYTENTVATGFYEFKSNGGVKRTNQIGLSLKRVQSGNFQVLVVDKPVKAMTRLLNWLEDTDQFAYNTPVLVVYPTPWFAKHEDTDFRKHVNDWFEGVDIPITLYTGDLKMPKVTFSASASSGISKYTGGQSPSPDSWKKLTPVVLRDEIFNDDDERPWIYVDMARFEIQNEGVSASAVEHLWYMLCRGSDAHYQGVLGIRASAEKIRVENRHLLVTFKEAMEEFTERVNKLDNECRSYLKHIYFQNNFHFTTEVGWLYRIGKFADVDTKWIERLERIEKGWGWSAREINGAISINARSNGGKNREQKYWEKRYNEIKSKFEKHGINLEQLEDFVSSNKNTARQTMKWIDAKVRFARSKLKQISEVFPMTWEMVREDTHANERILYMLEIELFARGLSYKPGDIYKTMDKGPENNLIETFYHSDLNKLIGKHNPIYAVVEEETSKEDTE
ncbi:RIIA lysis inhibitor [Vibrio phage VAP7]|uniref:Histidine kinase-like ATPase n=1 Tax=Vibrio phage VAP7 TaxID=2584487 RepID=A0A4Y5TVB9_9CAUD|nr:RIIA lysis inhibitor [Vibrio phage VAP7]QDB73302.1 histidine kinase-like ATPase [Vibrio phage VAP7]